jgi:hypothetical protein
MTLMEPWAGNPTNIPGILKVRPWGPPENEGSLEANRKNSKHPSVVQPPVYDTFIISLRRFLLRKGLDPARGIRGPMTEANVVSVRKFMAG